MLAVITTSKFQYDRYCEIKGLKNLKDAKQVSILKDIKGEKFTDSVFIEESDNVTDYVVKELENQIYGETSKK